MRRWRAKLPGPAARPKAWGKSWVRGVTQPPPAAPELELGKFPNLPSVSDYTGEARTNEDCREGTCETVRLQPSRDSGYNIRAKIHRGNRTHVETRPNAGRCVPDCSRGLRPLGHLPGRGRRGRSPGLQCRPAGQGHAVAADPHQRSALGTGGAVPLSDSRLRTGGQDSRGSSSTALLLLLRSYGAQQLAQLL